MTALSLVKINMKAIIFILFSLILVNKNGASQITFNKVYYTPWDERIKALGEDGNQNIIFGGVRRNNLNQRWEPIVYKINHKGVLVDSLIVFNNMPYDIGISDFIYYNSQYFFIGYTQDLNSTGSGPNDKFLFYLKTDTNFNIVDTNYFSVVNNQDAFSSMSRLDKQGNIITVGFYQDPATLKFGSFLTKISSTGDSLGTITLPVDSSRLFEEFMFDSSYYYVFTHIYSYKKPAQIYKFDTSLTLIDRYNISPVCQKQYAPILTSNSIYYTCGYYYGTSNRKLSVLKSKIDGSVIAYKHLGVSDSNNYTAWYKGLAKLGDYFYIFGTPYSSDAVDPYFGGNKPSSVYLSKLDSNLNIVWEKLYGGDAFYSALKIISTQDHGLLLMASRNDLYDGQNQLDVCLIKIDSNGTTTWIKDIKFPQSEVSLYPNPVRDILSVELKSKNQNIKDYRIIDLQGKIIYSGQSRTGQFKLDVSNLATGIYIFYGESGNGIVFRRRFIKY